MSDATPTAHGKIVCAGLDTSLGLRFVQERLALFGKTVFFSPERFTCSATGPCC